MPNAVDLFSGCGGLTLGLAQAGFAVRVAVEIDELAVETYRLNHPDVEVIHDDIRHVTADQIWDHLPSRSLDLLAGCPPCEGFSRLRSRNGKHEVDDDRNDLVFEWLRLVRLLRPRAVMLENVPQLSGDDRFDQTLCTLKQLGYQTRCDVLNAADHGVPQRRRRLILLGVQGATPDLPNSDIDRRSVRDALSGLPTAGKSGDPAHDLLMRNTERIKALIEAIPLDGGSRRDLPVAQQLDCHRDFDGFKDVYGRMAWDDVAPTITGGCASPSKGRFLHPTQHRVITIREAAVLQGFPSDYKISMRRGRYAAAEMVGNALPPPMISRLAKSVLAALEHAA